MAAEEPISQTQADMLLYYAQVTYRAATDLRRRMALIAMIITVTFGVVALWATFEWLTTRSAVAAVADESIVDVMGVQIPDPRPALERGELRVKAFAWSLVAGSSTLLCLLAGGIYWLVRPTPLPPELRALPPPRRPGS